MKKNLFLSCVSLVVMFLIGFTACSSDPSKDEVFVGTYNGLVTYGSVDGGLDLRSNKDGSVTVTKIGNSYTFVFSDEIPALNNIQLETRDENADEYKGEGLNKITITKNKLNIFFNKDGKNWTATCTRETEKE